MAVNPNGIIPIMLKVVSERIRVLKEIRSGWLERPVFFIKNFSMSLNSFSKKSWNQE